MLDRLPPESATKTAMRDKFTDEELAAFAKSRKDEVSGHGALSRTDLILYDVIDTLRWVEHAVYRSQGAKPPQPEPVPRPGYVDPKKEKELAGVRPLNPAGLTHLQQLRATRERD